MQILDTNVLLRYLLDDDPVQSPQARRFIKAGLASDHGLLIPDLAFAEAAWVMQGLELDRAAVASTLLEFAADERLLLENRERLIQALDLYRRGVKFGDAYLASAAKDLGAEALVSFDKGFSRMEIRWVDPAS